MPTDARQVAEMNARIIAQQDRAIELLDVKDQHLKGWQLKFKEMTEQWVKENNEHAAVVAALEAQVAELKRGLALTHKAWEADRLLWEASLADVTENRDRWYAKWERMAEIARAAQAKGTK